jgi:hypothetical protein
LFIFFLIFFKKGWYVVECYSVDEVSNVILLRPENFTLFTTYYIQVFETVGPEDNTFGSPLSTTVTMLVFIRTKALKDFKFASISESLDICKYYYLYFIFILFSNFICCCWKTNQEGFG